MPQMSNLWWLSIMLMTSLSFILSKILIYHSIMITHKTKFKNNKKLQW